MSLVAFSARDRRVLVLGLALSACFDPELRRPTVDAGEVDARDAAPLDSGADEGGRARDAAEMPTPDASLDSGTPGPAHHSQCRDPVPDPLPDSPRIPLNIRGEPRYNDWSYLSCDEASNSFGTCDERPEGSCTSFAICASVEDGERGVCMYHAELIDEPTQTPVTYRQGACLQMVAPANKAGLCCDWDRRVDCRLFPLSRNDPRSRPGELCTEHSDCEPGLLCAAADPNFTPGTARCVCPGVDGTRLGNGIECGAISQPSLWGVDQLDTTSGCTEALEPGFVVERIADVPCRTLSAAEGTSGSLHVICTDVDVAPERRAQHVSNESGAWVSTSLETEVLGESALVIAADGTLHAVIAGSDPLRYLRRTDGTWTLEEADVYASLPALALRADGALGMAYQSFSPAQAGYALHGKGGFEALPVETAFTDALYLRFDGDLPIVYYSVDEGEPMRVAELRAGVFVPRSIQGIIEGPLPGRALSGLTRGNTTYLIYSEDGEAQEFPVPNQLVLLTETDGVFRRKVLGDTHDEHFVRDWARSSIDVDASGKPVIAYRSAWGIRLDPQGDTNGPMTLTPEAENPALVMVGGEPHVFYSVVHVDPFDGSVSGELRHVHRGTCPP